MILEDGKGGGNSAEVDDHGRLYTKANVISHMSHHATYHKNAFIKNYNTTLPGTSETVCMIAINDSSANDIESHWLRISANADVEIKIYVDGVYASGGTLVVQENTNRTSKSISSIIGYEGGASGNIVLDTTNEKEIDGFFCAANAPIDIDLQGGIIFGKENSIAVKAIGAGGDKIKITLATSAHPAGSKL